MLNEYINYELINWILVKTKISTTLFILIHPLIELKTIIKESFSLLSKHDILFWKTNRKWFVSYLQRQWSVPLSAETQNLSWKEVRGIGPGSKWTELFCVSQLNRRKDLTLWWCSTDFLFPASLVIFKSDRALEHYQALHLSSGPLWFSPI